MKKYRPIILSISISLLILTACNKDWDEHYKTPPVASNESVWNALQNDASVSSFVDYLKQNQFDTLFIGNNTYTIFAPKNEAFAEFLQGGDSVTSGLLAYHISPFFIQTSGIIGLRKIQTLLEKFALLNNTGDGILLDNITIASESPLYRNGKYFVLNNVAKVKPNIYEYISLTNPVLKRYIDSEDSVFLDKDKSTPLGFDENGNTIYDTVADIINMFEVEFFPVSEEYRNMTATLVFPNEENYNDALDRMATSMNAGYTDHTDIPLLWQYEVLIPYLLEHGVFENMLEREEFLLQGGRDSVKLKNILGDSVNIDYIPGEKTILSNGYAYNYAAFDVPDTLYQSPTRFEPEWLAKSLGASRFQWYDEAKVISDRIYPPSKQLVASASNDTILVVNFDKGYTGRFILEFNIENLFPRRYLAVFKTRVDRGGIFNIYMNDQLIRTFDYGVDIVNSTLVYSVIPGIRYFRQASGYILFDCWLENLETYGKAKMKFEYKGPSTITSNGLLLDYIEFQPYDL